MIIKKYCYECIKCHELYFIEEGKYFSKICPICDVETKLEGIYDCNTELAEKAKNMPPYDPTKDPKSPYYIPVIECPYCHSTNTNKISGISKAGSVALFGVFAMGKVSKQWHCNSCKSEF